MTYEELRITYQCPEQMARDLFKQLATAQAMHTMEQALRARAEKKLAAATTTAPRRAYRQDEEK